MKPKLLLCLACLCFLIVGSAFGKRKKETFLSVIEAFSQRTLPGVRHGVPPPPVVHFIVVWENKQHPSSFYWQTDSSALACSVTRVHRVTDKQQRTIVGIEYTSEPVVMNNIKKGDTLDIMPIRGSKAVVNNGKANVPTENNTLFFEVGGSLKGQHIDAITKKHDIAMP